MQGKNVTFPNIPQLLKLRRSRFGSSKLKELGIFPVREDNPEFQKREKKFLLIYENFDEESVHQLKVRRNFFYLVSKVMIGLNRIKSEMRKKRRKERDSIFKDCDFESFESSIELLSNVNIPIEELMKNSKKSTHREEDQEPLIKSSQGMDMKFNFNDSPLKKKVKIEPSHEGELILNLDAHPIKSITGKHNVEFKLSNGEHQLENLFGQNNVDSKTHPLQRLESERKKQRDCTNIPCYRGLVIAGKVILAPFYFLFKLTIPDTIALMQKDTLNKFHFYITAALLFAYTSILSLFILWTELNTYKELSWYFLTVKVLLTNLPNIIYDDQFTKNNDKLHLFFLSHFQQLELFRLNISGIFIVISHFGKMQNGIETQWTRSTVSCLIAVSLYLIILMAVNLRKMNMILQKVAGVVMIVIYTILIMNGLTLINLF